MKKKGLFATMLIGIAALVGTLTGCVPDGGTAKEPFIKNTEDAFAFAAVSGGSLLALDNRQTVQFAYAADIETDGEVPHTDSTSSVVETPDPLESQIEEVNKYLNMFEGMIGTDTLQTTIQYHQTYKEIEYDCMMTVTVANLDGSKTEYVMYYSETKINAEDADGEEEEDREDEEDEDQEIESKIEGVMLMGGSDYAIVGEKETEGDEVEVKFTTTAEDGSKIVVKQEIEQDEQSFRYTVFGADGKKVRESKVEIEQEDGEIEIKLEFSDGTGKPQIFKFEKELEDGKSKIQIRYTDAQGDKMKATVEIKADENGKSYYSYRFQNGNEKEMGRFDFDDED